MHAVRNIRLCTKDCLCLFVCPTGATNTETGQIDATKCLDGCHACVDACTSHAISLIPDTYPPQQKKSIEVIDTLSTLSKNKIQQERIALNIASISNDPIIIQLAKAVSKSNHLMAEDLLRESGFMLPQSQNVQDFLQDLLDSNKSSDFPNEDVKKLIRLLGK